MTVKLEESVRILADDDGAVLFDPSTGRCFSLNSVGAFIVERLQSGTEPEALICALQIKFPSVDIGKLRGDTAAFLKSLNEKGVLQDASA